MRWTHLSLVEKATKCRSSRFRLQVATARACELGGCGLGYTAREPFSIDKYERIFPWSQQFGKTPPSPQATRRSSSKETTTSHPPRLTTACSRQAHTRLSVRSKAPRDTSTFALVVHSTRTRPGPTPSQIRLRRPSEVTSLSGRECTLRSGSPDQPVSAPCHRAEGAPHCRGGDAGHEPHTGRTPYPGVTA